jgi:Leucine-rich repeat (LRR) protein
MGCGINSKQKDLNILMQKIKKGNMIKTFNFDKMELCSLKILDNHLESKDINVFSATDNKLDRIPLNFFKNLNKVIKIDFSHNRYEKIDSVILEKQALQFLNFSNNYIYKIPAEISNLINLKELEISFNQIGELPSEFNKLTNLENLNLSHNIFISFPNIILSLPKIETFNVSHNNIKEFNNDENWKISNLKNLDLSFNKLTYIASNLLKYSKVSKLNLKGNSIDRTQFIRIDGYLEFEQRRKERKDQGYYKNLDISFGLCGLE